VLPQDDLAAAISSPTSSGRFSMTVSMTPKSLAASAVRNMSRLELLARVLHVNFIEPLLHIQDFLGVQHDVGCLALEPT
jgi:hypothetical protein